jgi:truncated hemoglobin YjbI
MDSMDLYQTVGGRDVCRKLSEAFYARVERDPVLRPLFPGKSMRCAQSKPLQRFSPTCWAGLPRMLRNGGR